MKITAEFVTSAARASDLPVGDAAAVALIGRSNVGKSSLINALVRQRIARTSGSPGKTRLANIYRVVRGTAAAMYIVDLPGYGYARGGNAGFDEIVQAVLGRNRATGQEGPDRQDGRETARSLPHRAAPAHPGHPASGMHAALAAILLVDSRHPGMTSDVEAWRWLQPVVQRRAIVATKIDKLTRGERIRALGQLESVFEHPVLPVSAVTGEGLDELWKLIDNLANRPRPNSSSPSNLRNPPQPPKATAVATAQALEKKTRPLRPRKR